VVADGGAVHRGAAAGGKQRARRELGCAHEEEKGTLCGGPHCVVGRHCSGWTGPSKAFPLFQNSKIIQMINFKNTKQYLPKVQKF
jgi:hypothetical protein